MLELNKLKKRIHTAFDNGMKNIHISWGPEADKMTVEDKASEVNKMLDSVEAHFALSPEDQMRIDMQLAYEEVKKALDLSSEGITTSLTKDRLKLINIFNHLDTALSHLNNHIDSHGSAG